EAPRAHDFVESLGVGPVQRVQRLQAQGAVELERDEQRDRPRNDRVENGLEASTERALGRRGTVHHRGLCTIGELRVARERRTVRDAPNTRTTGSDRVPAWGGVSPSSLRRGRAWRVPPRGTRLDRR